ncbi:hypothetical protein RFN66_22285 [Bacillus paralicheniformis]|uniref:hypothetical protein n=1 Tax=Bacillus paralicheniformis TaxID=1648923 RepID=UPI00137E419A|nr:hypothetical protein [Bacillus paralicheniformis]TWK88277.1 hypothetical protein CHCC20333_3406 [Bacillus paralicheniformis]WMW47288.1 hypothetical protein RFN66_22285 [Bacillus paralicheniformis]
MIALILIGLPADEFQETLGRYSQSASSIIQKAMFLFMKEGYFEKSLSGKAQNINIGH